MVNRRRPSIKNKATEKRQPMNHLRYKIFFTLFLFSLTGLNSAYADYTKTIVTGTALETPSTNWAAGDDSSTLVNLGFTFPFGLSSSHTQATINSNGALTFSGNWTTWANESLPSTDIATIIAPYWDDLNRSNGGTIRYDTFGSVGNRRFVVAWTNVPHYPNSGSYTFQVVLYENGDIRFRYSNGCTSCTGGSATIGVQESASVSDQHLFNSATLNTSNDILYTPVAPPLYPAISPSCASPNPQLTLTTYKKNGYNHPNNHADFDTLVTNYAIPSKLFGSGLINNINTTSNNNNNPFGSGNNYLSIIKGYIYAPEDGVYLLGVDGDDAIEVIIDGTVVSGWYGGHGKANSAQNIGSINLATGYHTVEFRHEDKNGNDSYFLYWQTPSQGALSIVPSNRLFHCPYAASISLSKTSAILSDPLNGTTNPKAIPGAIAEYTLTAINSGSAPADNNIITDSLNTLITTQQYAIWASGFLTIQSPNLYGGAVTSLTDVADGDEGQFIDTAGNREVIVDCGTLTTGQECVVKYRIIIN